MDTLIVGNVNVLSYKSIKHIFGDQPVILCDDKADTLKKGHIRSFSTSPLDESFDNLFVTYGFERVIYISGYLDPKGNPSDEPARINAILALARKVRIRQMIYIAPQLSEQETDSSKGIVLRGIIELLSYYSDAYDITTKIIISPYVTGNIHKGEYFTELFDMVSHGQEIRVGTGAASHLNLLYERDLADFLFRLLDDWRNESEYIHLERASDDTCKDFVDKLEEFEPSCKIVFASSAIPTYAEPTEQIARSRYGWFARYRIVDLIPDMYRDYKKSLYKKQSFTDKLRHKLHLSKILLMILELIIGTLAVQLLIRMSGSSVQFRLIDYRLLFVVVMSTVWGMTAAFLSATLMVLSLAFSYYQNGAGWLMLFYDPGNWVPFILYYVVGAICAYTRKKKEEENSFVKEENEKLEKQNEFISELYDEALQYKNEYKQNLTLSKQGFGRIFDVVKKLNHANSERIFAESVPVMEDILDNHAIAIYTIYDNNSKFARLEVSSPQISRLIRKSIDLGEYKEIVDTLAEGELWINRNPSEGTPSYVAGVLADGVVTVMIAVYNVSFSQMSTYYANLIRILAGLIENFIVKAWQYQRAVRKRQFYRGTGIMYNKYFRLQVGVHDDMEDNEIMNFRLIRIMGEGRDANAWEEILRGKTRYNDAIGLCDDGNIYILAAQVDESTEEIVLDRFRSLGLDCAIVDELPPDLGIDADDSEDETLRRRAGDR